MFQRKPALMALCVLLVTGAAQAQSPSEIQRPERTQFGDWVFACDPATDQCMMQQILMVEGRPVMTIMIGFNEHHRTEPLIAMNVPKGLRAGDLITIQVAGKDMRGIPVAACDERMCTGIAKLDGKAAEEFKTGAAARVTIPSAGPRLAFDVSLTGFSTAYDAMLARKSPS